MLRAEKCAHPSSGRKPRSAASPLHLSHQHTNHSLDGLCEAIIPKRKTVVIEHVASRATAPNVSVVRVAAGVRTQALSLRSEVIESPEPGPNRHNKVDGLHQLL